MFPNSSHFILHSFSHNAPGERHNKIRKELKVAIKEKDRAKLQKSVKEFKEAKLADTEGDLAKAEGILKRFKARDGKLWEF